MRLIGLSGKAGSGKDTVAEMIGQEAGKGAVFRISFADAIKEIAKKLGWNGEKDTNGRVLLQYIGVREREVDELFWVRKAFERIQELRVEMEPQGGEFIAVITDVRFLNETEAIQSAGGEVWRIERPGAGLTGKAALHPSEIELDDFPGFDVILDNVGTLDELREKVKRHL